MPKTYDPIATQTLGSAAATVTFSSIPSTYTDLILVSVPIASSGSTTYVALQFNGDTGTNYSETYMTGSGSAATSARDTSVNATYLYNSGAPTTTGLNVITHIQNYSNSTTNKTLLTRSNNSAAFVNAYVGLWRNTAAITSIVIAPVGGSGTYAAGSTFTLYGIKAA